MVEFGSDPFGKELCGLELHWGWYCCDVFDRYNFIISINQSIANYLDPIITNSQLVYNYEHLFRPIIISSKLIHNSI
jgi:hypothetical protein